MRDILLLLLLLNRRKEDLIYLGILNCSFQLSSNDSDTEENAITRYRLSDENEDASLFYLDEESGRLFAMNRFDRETRDIYQVRSAKFSYF